MISLAPPELQIGFTNALAEIRERFLQDALSHSVKCLKITELDKQLAEFVPEESLAALAGHGLRAELMFPVPLILAENPYLLAYYRLLYGYSQKEFYAGDTGLSRFKSMETRGVLTKANEPRLSDLTKALCTVGTQLLDGIGEGKITASLLDDLTLLTLGPQLRGGANVRKGASAIVVVFNAIHAIVEKEVVQATKSSIEIKNAADRPVWIEFAPDPDIIIREQMAEQVFSKKIAIEVKGGSDFSNIHNRIGEAEKSHQKAKAAGYVECWTVVNVDRIDMAMAKQESPSTNQFYRISDITSGSGDAFEDFRHRVISLTGIRT